MEAKEALANTTVLLHPFMDAPTSVITDASDIVVGAILQQFIQDEWCPISYFSRKLKPAKTRCSTFWPGTTLASWIQHFQHILKGCQFYILTNNKPLIYSLPSSPNGHSLWQIRPLDFISQFASDIHHIQGCANQVADALSRVQAVSQVSAPAFDFDQLAIAQHDDSSAVWASIWSKLLKTKRHYLPSCGHLLTYDTSTGAICQVVPAQLRCSVLDHHHSLSHPGIRATPHLITTRYVWPGINKDFWRWAKMCIQCRQSNIHQHQMHDWYGTHWYCLSSSSPDGFTHLYWSVYVVAGSHSDCSHHGRNSSSSFVGNWIGWFGVPSTLSTNRGRQFDSNLWNELMYFNRLSYVFTPQHIVQASTAL